MQSSKNKTFDLRTPKAFLDKLDWDLRKLLEMERQTSREIPFQAMNCALTAWHMHEWIYLFLPMNVATQYPTLKAFANFVKKDSDYIRCCRELADSTKHFQITRDPHPDIHTESVAVSLDGRESDILWLVDVPNVGLTRISHLIAHSQAFWIAFMCRNGIYKA